MRLLSILILVLFAFSQPSGAEDGRNRFWRISAAVLAGASVADVHSSWGKHELNPVLRNGQGRFGWQGLAVKSGVTGGALLLQWLVLRNHARASKSAAIGNLVVSGMLTGIAIRNHTIPKPVPAGPKPVPAVPLRQ